MANASVWQAVDGERGSAPEAGEGNVASVAESEGYGQAVRTSSPVVPFLLGAAIGATAGAVAGTLLSRYGVHLIAAMIGAVDRRMSRDERDKLRFELLLQ